MKTSVGTIGNKKTRPYTGPAGTAFGIAVKQGATDGAVILVTGSGQRCIGIVEEADVSNKGLLSVVWEGEQVAIAGAAIVADQDLIADATGRLIPSVTAGDQVLARAVTSAAAAGDEVVVQLNRFIK
jgi:hypothetical protein